MYLFGYYGFCNDRFIETIMEYKKWILGLFVIFQLLLCFLYYSFAYYGDFFVNFVGWLGVLSCFIFGNAFLKKETKITNYLRKASYSIYILHQTILVVIGYYVFRITNDLLLQFLFILFGSMFVTLVVYEVVQRIPILKNLIGER